jgi:hypothetical protein
MAVSQPVRAYVLRCTCTCDQRSTEVTNCKYSGSPLSRPRFRTTARANGADGLGAPAYLRAVSSHAARCARAVLAGITLRCALLLGAAAAGPLRAASPRTQQTMIRASSQRTQPTNIAFEVGANAQQIDRRSSKAACLDSGRCYGTIWSRFPPTCKRQRLDSTIALAEDDGARPPEKPCDVCNNTNRYANTWAVANDQVWIYAQNKLKAVGTRCSGRKYTCGERLPNLRMVSQKRRRTTCGL